MNIGDFSFLPILKGFAVFALVLYTIFALVLVRQVQLMTDTLVVGFEKPVRLLSVVHLLFAVAVFLLTLFVL
jgi:hypothetical protein